MLYLASFLYIAVPLVIFAFGWLQLPLVLLVGVGFLYSIYRLVKSKKLMSPIFLSRKELGIIAILLLMWTLLSGAGHWALVGDGYKHNAIFNDLISLDWPVAYLQKNSSIVYLCYYIAYYLPAALVGKVLGAFVGHIALFLWTSTGVGIALLWFLSLFKKSSKAGVIVLFMFFSGLDAVGRFILRNKLVNSSDWEWWARNWQYSGNTTLLFYVPQHALVGWIVMGMLAYGLLNKKPSPLLLILISCVPLWSPFVFLGLLPFVGIYFFQTKQWPSLGEGIISFLFLSFQLLYLSSNLTLITKESHVAAWLWDVEKLTQSWALVRLLLFYLLEFGVFAFCINRFVFVKKRGVKFILFITSLIILFLLPWYKMGLMNDFVMRMSIPSLWIIGYLFIETLVQSKVNKNIRYILYFIFFIGTIYPFVQFINGAKTYTWKASSVSLTTYEDVVFRTQYFGSSKSILFQHFAKTSGQLKKGKIQYK